MPLCTGNLPAERLTILGAAYIKRDIIVLSYTYVISRLQTYPKIQATSTTCHITLTPVPPEYTMFPPGSVPFSLK